MSFGYHPEAKIEYVYAPAYTKDHFIMLRYEVATKSLYIMDSLYSFADEGKHSDIVQARIDLFDLWLEKAGF